MSYLNILITNEAGSIWRASIPKETSELYVQLNAIVLKQNPNEFIASKDNISKLEVNKIIRNLLSSSASNVRLYLGECGKEFIEMIDNNTYCITMSVDNYPILNKSD